MPLGFEACAAEALCHLKVNKSKEVIITKLDESIGIVFKAAIKPTLMSTRIISEFPAVAGVQV